MSKRTYVLVMAFALATVLVTGGLMAGNMGFKLAQNFNSFEDGVYASGESHFAVAFYPHLGLSNAGTLKSDIEADPDCAGHVGFVQRFNQIDDQRESWFGAKIGGTNFDILPCQAYFVTINTTARRDEPRSTARPGAPAWGRDGPGALPGQSASPRRIRGSGCAAAGCGSSALKALAFHAVRQSGGGRPAARRPIVVVPAQHKASPEIPWPTSDVCCERWPISARSRCGTARGFPPDEPGGNGGAPRSTPDTAPAPRRFRRRASTIRDSGAWPPTARRAARML